MRDGVARDGSHLMPAFPYYAFTKLSDDDVKGLYAYLMTRPAINSTVPANTLPFPLNVRAFQEGWKILFFRSARYQADQSKSAEWNRGAYLAEESFLIPPAFFRNLLGSNRSPRLCLT
jgi:mono/diheme cytochrome c family protein